MESLLKSARVKLAGHANSGVTLLIEHDKSRVNAAEQDVRCTASIQATVRLDPATHFPMHLEGEVVDSGCEGDTTPVLHYGEDAPKGRTHRMLHKGTTFRLEYSLEPDKFGNPAHSYWIAVEQHWSRPILRGAGAVIYGNRKFGLAPVVPNRRMLQDSQTAAREFGSESVTRFDTAK